MATSPLPEARLELELERWSDRMAPPLARLLGHAVELSLLCGGKEAADDTLKLRVADSRGISRAVVLVASPVAPELVARGVERAAAAKAALGPEIGDVILEPLMTGLMERRSYCVLPYHTPMRHRGLVARLQYAWLGPTLLAWLRAAARHTLAPVGSAAREQRFERALTHLLDRDGVSGRVRSAAERSLVRLRDGKWTPRHVLMHGDLWCGNVLLAPAPGLRRPRTILIDWPGAAVRGHAIYDLIRLAQSLRMGRAAVRREIACHAAILGCDPTDTAGHLLAGLGHVGLHIDRFPVARYQAMTDACVATLEAAL